MEGNPILMAIQAIIVWIISEFQSRVEPSEYASHDMPADTGSHEFDALCVSLWLT